MKNWIVVMAVLLFCGGNGFTREALPDDEGIRDAIVKIYAIHNRPSYYEPWNMEGARPSTGSGCVLSRRRILTNAHVVSDETFLQVRRYGDAKRYRARVLSVSHEADLALLTVDDPAFFDGITPLELGGLPQSQDEVLVYGFPLGGDTLSTTKGVVSRFEHQTYSHSSVYLLAGQIDAAINPGNSGGPVIREGKVVGVVMQTMTKAENIGYMVPVNRVQHFERDLEDGRYEGIPSLGVVLQDMENEDLKARYRVPEGKSGVRIVKVLPGAPADGILEVGDVWVDAEGEEIADDGTIDFRGKERTSVSYLIQEKQVGETIDLNVLRDGVLKEVTVTLSRSSAADLLIPTERYDRRPSYFIYGGILFCPLTKDLIKAWGQNWYNTAPREWLAQLGQNHAEEARDEMVIALKVLPADVNEGYHRYGNWIIREVNGTPVRSLRHLVSLVEAESDDPFVVFADNEGREIVLDRKKAVGALDFILNTYRIRADRSDDLIKKTIKEP